MTAIDNAIAFLDTQPRPLELAWTRCLAGSADSSAVTAAMAIYQNPDGGFGNGLEVDIKAPDSQPFAARLAMAVALDCQIPVTDPVIAKLAGWLESEQQDDGCWHFAKGVYQHSLAPWFMGWTFPSLNPALCVAGAAKRLGIGSPRLFDRVATLAGQMSTLQEAETGAFYEILPYAEYYPWVDGPESQRYVDAIAKGIIGRIESGGYDDAGHVFEHAGGPDSAVSRAIPPALIEAQLQRLIAEQEADGGWPSPYDPLWRCTATAHAISILRAYGRI